MKLISKSPCVCLGLRKNPLIFGAQKIFDFLGLETEISDNCFAIVHCLKAVVFKNFCIIKLLKEIHQKVENGSLDIIRAIKIYQYNGPVWTLYYELNSKGNLQIRQRIDNVDEHDIVAPYSLELSKHLNRNSENITLGLIKRS